MGKRGRMWEDVEIFCIRCMELPLYLTISEKKLFYIRLNVQNILC